MQVDLFRYSLRRFNVISNSYQYYFVDANGVVQSSFTPTALQYAPQGWEDQSLKWERGTKYYGVFTNYTNPLRFVKDGRKIIKTLYYNNGVNQVLELLIEKHSNLVASWGYQTYYVGDIDFSRFKDAKDFTQVEIMEQGFMAKLKANEDTMYETPIAGGVWVKLDGYPLGGVAEWASATNGECLALASRYYPILSNYFNDGYNVNFYTTTQMVEYSNTNELYLIENISDSTQSIDFVYDYNVDVYNGTTGFSGPLHFHIVASLVPNVFGPITDTSLYVSPTAMATGTSQLFTGTLTWSMNIPAGYRVTIRYFGTATPTPTPLYPSVAWKATETNGGSKLSANWLSKVPETYVQCLTQQQVGEALTQKIDANSDFVSPPATATESYLLTSGDALRNLNNAVIKTSLDDFFKASNCMHNIGLWYDKTNSELHFDYKDDVFDTSTASFDIGEVASLQVEPYIPEMYAVTKFGYKRYDYDTINGKEEFNIDYTWNTPLVRMQGSRDLISPYRADMYGIELVRANLAEKTNADSDNDNDVFWIHADLSAVAGTIPAGYQGAGQNYYELYRDNSLTITGLISPADAYNIDFSPKRRMFQHGNHIVSSLTPYTSSVLTYVNSSKTQNGGVYLITDDGSTIIDEQENETIGNLSTTPYFVPYLFTIEVKIPVTLQEIFDTGMQRFAPVQFSYKGNTYEGFIIEASDSPTYRPKQTFKLLAKAGTNLTNLINGL
jgi:hypothetical protein